MMKIEEICSEIKRDIEDIFSLPSEEACEAPGEPRTLEMGGAIFTNLPSVREQTTQDFGVQIRKVPKGFLGYRVLGRAFPHSKVIEIADDLEGDEFEEVKLHELLHIQDSYASEYDIRSRTRSLLGKTKWNW